MNIVQQYENSIYFTDQVIKSIFDKFADNGRVLLVYVSDHAEVVSNALQGHGFLPTYRDEYQIPLVIYSNIDNERVKGLYKENKKHFFNTENLDSIITYISYISDDVNISKSSEIFSLEPRNKFDFNKLKGYKQFWCAYNESMVASVMFKTAFPLMDYCDSLFFFENIE